MRKLITIGLLGFLLGCGQDDGPKLPSVEERIEAAIEELQDALVEPVNGWRLDYRPTNQTGSFLILLDFRNDGTVRVQSDVQANDGEFRDQDLSYRIDSSQGIELIFETYGVFHYLFEQQQASFGGEFEFLFVEETNNTLVFRSKTDNTSDVTEIEFVRSDGTYDDEISTSTITELAQGIFSSPNLAQIGNFGTYNIYIPENNHTLSVSFDLERRIIKFVGIAEGQTIAEIEANNNAEVLNQSSSFSLSGNQIILDDSELIVFNGINYPVTSLPIENFDKDVETFCTGREDSVVMFNSSGTSGLGDITITSSPFQVNNNFRNGDGLLAINPLFIYDDNDNSLVDQIEAVFPGALSFQWYQEFDLGDSLFNAVGFVTLDEFNNAEFFLRIFDFERVGNSYQLTFTGENFISNDNPTQEQIDGLEQLTDLIFSGGQVFPMEIVNFDGLYLFFNPCNGYKGYLFN